MRRKLRRIKRRRVRLTEATQDGVSAQVAQKPSCGRTDIPSVVFTGEIRDGRLRTIAENLHRADLTALERSEQTAEWVRLTEETQDADKLAQLGPVSEAGGRGNEGGIRAAVRELGIKRTQAQRAIAVASLAPEAKQAAVAAGMDDNQTALLEAARQPTPEAQVAYIEQRAAHRPTPTARERWKADWDALLARAEPDAGTHLGQKFLIQLARDKCFSP